MEAHAAVLIMLLLAVSGLVVNTFALDWATWLARRLTAYYVRGLPAQISRRKREEAESEVYEEGAYWSRVGHRPIEIAVLVVWRELRSIPDSLEWRDGVRRRVPLAELHQTEADLLAMRAG